MTAAATPTPIFNKTHDLLKWLLPITAKFPREQRFVLATAMQQACFMLQQRLLEAQRSARPAARLLPADVALAQLRLHWRLALDWQFVSPRQFEHGVRLMDEVGRLLGAWIKACERTAEIAAAMAAKRDAAQKNFAAARLRAPGSEG